MSCMHLLVDIVAMDANLDLARVAQCMAFPPQFRNSVSQMSTLSLLAGLLFGA